MSTKINKPNYNEKQYKDTLIRVLKEKTEGATLADMVVATGLPTDWVEFTIRKLLGEYPVQFITNAQNELVYHFDFTPPQKSLQQTLQEILEVILQTLWKAFVFGFKVWILLMLFTYMLFNIVVLAIAVVGATRNGDALRGVFEIIGKIFKGAFQLVFQSKKKEIGLVQQVFSYVFGATPNQEDKLQTEKNILALIRNQKGILRTSDIIQLTGSSWRDAQQQAAQLLANYQGDIRVTDEGVILYEFKDLVTETGKAEKVAPIWERLISEVQMNDNDSKTNWQITGVNGFNMVMSVVSPFLIQYMLFDWREMPRWIYFWAMIFPLIFSTIFFLIPLLRRPFVQIQNQKIKKKNRSYLILGELFKRLPQAIFPQKDSRAIAEVVLDLPIKEIEKLIEEKALELEAEPHSDEQGNVYYEFNEINLEKDLKLNASTNPPNYDD